MKAFLAVLFAATVASVSCLPSGPPLQACEGVSPIVAGHGVGSMTAPSPYCVNIGPLYIPGNFTYIPGCTYYLAFLGCGGSNFTVPNRESAYQYRGFFVQSRDMDDNRVGTFSVRESTFSGLSNCPISERGINHITRDDKTCTVFGWTAPNAGTGDLEFRFAGVRIQREYWGDQTQPGIIREGTGSAPDDCPMPFDRTMLCGADGAIGTVSALSVLLVSLVLALLL